MATPEFIRDLREQIGHDQLFLSGVTMVVVDDDRVLLCRRTEDGPWSLVTGIIEPGEQPAVAGVREVLEETGIRARVERLSSVYTQDPVTFPNGDRCQFLDVAFRCSYVGGEARVNDDESVDVGWFPLADLPDLTPHSHLKLEHALSEGDEPWFVRPWPDR